MRVLITASVKVIVHLPETDDLEVAKRAIRENWDSYYKGRFAHTPLHYANKLLSVEAAP